MGEETARHTMAGTAARESSTSSGNAERGSRLLGLAASGRPRQANQGHGGRADTSDDTCNSDPLLIITFYYQNTGNETNLMVGFFRMFITSSYMHCKFLNMSAA